MRNPAATGLDTSALPPWLAAFVSEAERETNTLRENGADQAATARSALTEKLVTAAKAWLDAELDVAQAARERGICQETIRRAVRAGAIPDLRPAGRGRLRIRRRDLARLAGHPQESYDPIADAQDIARLRSKL
jgi:hypothetical protein